MDLEKHLEIGGLGLLGILDADNDFMPTNGYETAHDLGRWWDAVIRLEETIGFTIPDELETVALKNLKLLTDNPDRLLMNRTDIPWMAGKAEINPHNFRETLLAYGGLIRTHRGDWAVDSATTLVSAMDRAIQSDGHLDLTKLDSWGQLPPSSDTCMLGKQQQGKWFDSTEYSGRAIEALVYLFQLTNDQATFDLAERLVKHHFAFTINPDGSMRDEILNSANLGHCHSYHGTLRGLLLFGLLTNENKYIHAIEKTYRNAVRMKIVKDSGWAPHDLGKNRFDNDHGDPVADPASAGDSTQLALWLAIKAGCNDLLDDVERLVRARLLPAQMTDKDIKNNPERAFTRREIGAWCIHGSSHGDKGCTPDVHAAVIHTLCDVYSHILTPTTNGVRVNLHFNAENETLKVISTRGKDAKLKVTVKQRDNVLIRIPSWTPESSIRFKIDGKTRPIKCNNAFARIPAEILKIDSIIELSYDLPMRNTEEEMPSGRRYRFKWRGDEITGIDPQEKSLPFYPSMT